MVKLKLWCLSFAMGHPVYAYIRILESCVFVWRTLGTLPGPIEICIRHDDVTRWKSNIGEMLLSELRFSAAQKEEFRDLNILYSEGQKYESK